LAQAARIQEVVVAAAVVVGQLDHSQAVLRWPTFFLLLHVPSLLLQRAQDAP